MSYFFIFLKSHLHTSISCRNMRKKVTGPLKVGQIDLNFITHVMVEKLSGDRPNIYPFLHIGMSKIYILKLF